MERTERVHISEMSRLLRVDLGRLRHIWGDALLSSPLSLLNYAEFLRQQAQIQKIEEHLDSGVQVINVSASKPRPLSGERLLTLVDEYSNLGVYAYYDPAPFNYGSIRPKGDPIIMGEMHAGMRDSFSTSRPNQDSPEPRELLRDEGPDVETGQGA